MTDLAHDLLHDPLITVATPEGHSRVSLPATFELLWREDDVSFPNLRAHQEQPWFCFLAQLAAMVDEARGLVPTTTQDWRDGLLELADGSREAWHLLVADAALPAFMQPPTPAGAPVPKSDIGTPDGLDFVTVPKTHDVKMARLAAGHVEAWLYSLVSLQTMEGYGGAGKNGIARMNSGTGSRTLVARYHDRRFALRLREDVAAMKELLPRQRSFAAAAGGTKLLWVLAWDGTSSASLDSIHPYAVEICRRVRFAKSGNGLLARDGTTKKPRIAAKEAKGLVGDPWTPIRKADLAALSVTESGLTLNRTLDLLTGSGDHDSSPLAETALRPDATYFCAMATARGQGKTYGFHARWVEIPKRGLALFRSADARDRVAEAGFGMLKEAKAARGALSWSIKLLIGGGTDIARKQDTSPWTTQFDQRVDVAFFDWLWRVTLDSEHPEWRVFLVQQARDLLETAIESAPIPSNRRFAGIASAEGALQGTLRKHHLIPVPEAS